MITGAVAIGWEREIREEEMDDVDKSEHGRRKKVIDGLE